MTEEKHFTNTDRPAPHVRTSDTSKESAEKLDASGKKNSLRKKVYETLHARGENGSTCEEMEALLDELHQSVSSTFRGLEKDGWVRKSGRYRITPKTKRRVNVYVIDREGDCTKPIKDAPESPVKRVSAPVQKELF